MKKRVLIIFLFLLAFSLFFISAESTQTEVSNKAYSCLESKVTDCSLLSTEEKIFTVLATGKCKTELNADASNGECWPKSDCSIKTTAQAILALGSGATNAENWLLEQTMSFTGMEWYLQVESNSNISCTATYSNSDYTFSISDDKVISGNAGSCLTVSDDYWFLIDSSCYGTEFKISCGNSFSTSLFYKKPASATFYVSGTIHSASGGGFTSEKVNPLCFGDGTCDYEGSLWATLVLSKKRSNLSDYLPYLVAMSDETANLPYIPYSFLYSLTNNFKIELLSKQIGNQYWEVSGDKFYDTAVALLPFQNQENTEKTNAKKWLGEIQGTDGCWEGGIRNTAFLLYSLWPKAISGGGEIPTTQNCEASNYFCRSSLACLEDGGQEMAAYSTSCFGTDVCCSVEEQIESCADQYGELCDSSEQCIGGTEVTSSDSNSEKFCCVSGTCGVPEISQCELNGGICRITCESKEKLSSYTCGGSDICCTPKKFNWVVLIVILIVLIILVVLGIIYRKQLKEFLLKVKAWFQSKFKKGTGKPSAPNTMTPPGRLPTLMPSTRVPPGAVQRRIIPATQQRAPIKPVQKKSDFDDVLKKLKDIGK